MVWSPCQSQHLTPNKGQQQVWGPQAFLLLDWAEELPPPSVLASSSPSGRVACGREGLAEVSVVMTEGLLLSRWDVPNFSTPCPTFWEPSQSQANRDIWSFDGGGGFFLGRLCTELCAPWTTGREHLHGTLAGVSKSQRWGRAWV